MITVLVADDHEIVRTGLRRMFMEVPDIQLVAEAASGTELMRVLNSKLPDVLILDVNLPDSTGCEALKRVMSLPKPPRVIMFTMYQEDSNAIPFFDAGASAFISKRRASSVLLEAIRKVHEGKRYITPDLADLFFDPGLDDQSFHKPLTSREIEVIRLLAQGWKSVEIAERMGISPSTVSTFVQRCKEKLGLRSVVELVRFAESNDLLG